MAAPTRPPVCSYCGKQALLTTGAALYPHLPKLASKKFWHCAGCEAWVGCHPAQEAGGNDAMPLGSLANAELRRWRTTAHQLFDGLWQSREMTRGQAYDWMARTLRLDRSKCHIASLEIDQCKSLVEALAARA